MKSRAQTAAQTMSGAGILVVGTMCATFLMTVATVCYLAVQQTEVPTQLETLVAALSVGVPALLAKSFKDARQGREEPTPVEVVGEPVLTQEVGTDVGHEHVEEARPEPEPQLLANAEVAERARRRPRTAAPKTL